MLRHHLRRWPNIKTTYIECQCAAFRNWQVAPYKTVTLLLEACSMVGKHLGPVGKWPLQVMNGWALTNMPASPSTGDGRAAVPGTINQCWFDVGPASNTVAQHQTNIDLMYRVYLEGSNACNYVAGIKKETGNMFLKKIFDCFYPTL